MSTGFECPKYNRKTFLLKLERRGAKLFVLNVLNVFAARGGQIIAAPAASGF